MIFFILCFLLWLVDKSLLVTRTLWSAAPFGNGLLVNNYRSPTLFLGGRGLRKGIHESVKPGKIKAGFAFNDYGCAFEFNC